MKTDLEKGTHFTTNAEYITQGLLPFVPTDVQLVEPFVGNGDLVKLFPNRDWEQYDIVAREGVIQQDTLTNPPDYSRKWIITNPPFLAKNKATDKTLFSKYNLDDHYKIALKTAIGCAGGLFIVPTNFFTDENSNKIRKDFLSKYRVLRMNIFTVPVFETTTYSICAFVCQREDNERQVVEAHVLPDGVVQNFELDKKYGFQFAGAEFAEINKQKNIFNRLTATSKDVPTNIKLYALDTRELPIRTEYTEEHFVGKQTDRVYLTFTYKEGIPEDIQRQMVEKFNAELNTLRKKYSNLIFTNYRDFNRKRIGFTFAYKLMTKIYKELAG